MPHVNARYTGRTADGCCGNPRSGIVGHRRRHTQRTGSPNGIVLPGGLSLEGIGQFGGRNDAMECPTT